MNTGSNFPLIHRIQDWDGNLWIYNKEKGEHEKVMTVDFDERYRFKFLTIPTLVKIYKEKLCLPEKDPA